MKINFNELVKMFTLVCSLMIASQANAGLIVRDGGMVYDDVLDITWLLDANYAKTVNATEADSNGKMTWDNANTWAGELTFGGFNNWRLASYDTGNSVKSELTHMFETNLGLTLGVNLSKETLQSKSDPFGITNLFTSRYWFDNAASATNAWSFAFSNGTENANKLKTDTYKAWVVRDGDIINNNVNVSVPEPTTFAIFALGLLGLAVRKKLNNIQFYTFYTARLSR